MIEAIRRIRMTDEQVLVPSETDMGGGGFVISVTEVYDQASGIGKELEKLIDCYGSEAVTGLMHKVVRSLELLEALAFRYEQENTEIGDLRYTISRLEAEKLEKAQERIRYERDLELIEDNWQAEVKELLQTIEHLQHENKQHRQMQETMEEHKKAAVAEALAASKRREEEELQVLSKLKETIDKQREQIRAMKKEINQKTCDAEALQAQLERIVKVNADLRRKNSSQRKQTRTLLEERLELQSQIQDKDKHIQTIKELLKESEAGSSGASFDAEMDTTTLTAEDLSILEDKLSKYGKIAVDMSDPNRPRFTMGELREVLMERNDLKTRLLEVEEELQEYKPKSENNLQDSDAMPSLAEELTDATDADSEEEYPVQGPINKEPEEKLYPYQKESGIRKFFRFLMGKTRERTSFSQIS